MLVSRTELVQAKASTIWKIFSSMEWEKWDPDVKAIEDVQGGLEDGSSLVFVMKEGGTKIKTIITEVKENEHFTFSGKILGGLVSFKGTFELTAEDDMTNVTYTFGMGGFGGSLVSMFNSKAIIEGTEGGIENVKKLPEEAEKSSAE